MCSVKKWTDDAPDPFRFMAEYLCIVVSIIGDSIIIRVSYRPEQHQVQPVFDPFHIIMASNGQVQHWSQTGYWQGNVI